MTVSTRPLLDSHDMQLASGIAAFEAKEFRRAMQLLEPLAQAGEAEAQFRLGVMLQNGLGAVPNNEAAYEWMLASASQGHALGQHGIGIMYLFGECVERDPERALGWFEIAATQGLQGALTTMAMMYQEGIGVAKDPERAADLYKQAGFDDLG